MTASRITIVPAVVAALLVTGFATGAAHAQTYPGKPVKIMVGDPAGIGPELVSRLLGDPATHTRADILLIGNRAGFVGASDVPVHRWAGLDAPAFERGVVTEKNGRFMLDALTVGARLVVEGSAAQQGRAARRWYAA